MNTNFSFKHESDNLPEALGIDKSILEGLGPKIIGMIEKFEKESTDSQQAEISVSKIIELLPDNFSDTEIAVLAGIQIKDSIMDAQKAFMSRGLPKEIQDMLDGLRKDKDFDLDAN